mmetsp:Transcript_16316/g.27576  ORF Transcript_16316/g.27576 Transcript_16316/m.27576 type:complete len:245 (-) Transcript_16316:54-788(-)
MKLKAFLEEKKDYDAGVLLEKVRDSWLFEVEIILLAKEKRHEEAICKFVIQGKFQEAEDFCNRRKELGLMTALLKNFFDNYEHHWQLKNKLLTERNTQESIEHKKKALEFKKQALDLMKKYSSGEHLDPYTVLQIIPEDWEIQSEDYNLINYLQSMFDHQLTVEENTKISLALSNMETLNKEKQRNEHKQAYLVIGDESMCKYCSRKLSYKYIKIYPNGGVYHSGCVKDDFKAPLQGLEQLPFI